MATVSAVTLIQAQRQFDKGQFKQALKDAKMCHRQSPGDASRQLIERCYLARGEELQRRGLADECRHVVEELMALGPRLPELRGRLCELLVRAGLYERFASKLETNTGSGGASSSIPIGLLADVAILADHASNCPAELRDGAASIRAALEALETGEAEAALSALDVIPRSSPFADWKLFVRGLAAYYRHDTAAMKANWDRLDPQRKAARIAARLKVVSDVAAGQPAAGQPAAGQPVDDAGAVLGLVERAAFENGVLSSLDHLRGILNGGDRRRIADALKGCVTVLGNRRGGLCDRLVELVAQRAICEGDRELLDQLMRGAKPPATDPKWNRTRAMFAEHPEEGSDDETEMYWQKYEQDLIEMPGWREDDRRLARTLVWLRLGKIHADWAATAGYGPVEFEDDEEAVKQVDDDRDEARRCFERARELAPEILQAWQAPIKACSKWESDDAQLAAHQRLLERFPEQFDSLIFVADQLVRREQSSEALSFFERARRLKPLDEVLQTNIWVARMSAAREAALAKKWADGRAHFAEAERCNPKGEHRWNWLAKRSIFERKAGDSAAAEQLDREACAATGEPTAAMLMMAIEAHRYKLPKTFVQSIEADWEKQLAKKCSSRTAGLMAQTMAAHLIRSITYTNRKTHVERVGKYLKRASRVKYERQELRHVCLFFATLLNDGTAEFDKTGLGSWSEQLRLAAGRGLKQFPDDPYFTLFSAHAAVCGERPRWDTTHHHARGWLKQTLELAEQHPDLVDEWVVSEAQLQLSKLEDAQHQSPFAGGPFGGNPFFDFPYSDDEEEDEDDDGMPVNFRDLEMGMFKRMFGSSKKSANAETFRGMPIPPVIGAMLDEICRATGMSREDALAAAMDTLPGATPKSKPGRKR